MFTSGLHMHMYTQRRRLPWWVSVHEALHTLHGLGCFGRLMLLYWNADVLAVSAVHKETKQFFTLYNTLDDRKVYLEKEVRAFI